MEHAAATTGSSRVQLFEHPDAKAVYAKGADALTWLQSLLTADVLKSSAGAVRSLSLDRLGKIQAELLVLPSSVDIRLVVVGGSVERLLAHLERYIVMEDVELRRSSARLFTLHGPGASDCANSLASVEGLRVARLAWVAADDVVCLVPDESVDQFRRCVEVRGIPIGGESDWDLLRIEHGLVVYGRDYDEHDTPGTAGLVDELVSQSKGCYLGQEVVCKMLMRGAIREQSVRMWFAGTPKVGDGVVATDSAQHIGKITSAASKADQDGRTWAIGRVKTSALEACVTVQSSGFPGRIVPRLGAS